MRTSVMPLFWHFSPHEVWVPHISLVLREIWVYRKASGKLS